MDRRERAGSLLTGLLAMSDGVRAQVWTALPGIIQGFDPVKRTAIIQPAIQGLVQDEAGNKNWVIMPLLVDCPVFFPGGGDFSLTFPLKRGDECLAIFASRCIDAWWQSGGVQVQAELRMNDLSDGFCFAGIASVPNVEAAISTTNVQLRNRAGTSYVEITPAGSVNVQAAGNISATAVGSITATGANITATTPGIATLAAPTIRLNGNVVVTGNFTMTGSGSAASFSGNIATTGTITNNGVDIGSTHKHSGVQAGGSNTGNPI